jgi:hypothetical protein
VVKTRRVERCEGLGAIIESTPLAGFFKALSDQIGPHTFAAHARAEAGFVVLTTSHVPNPIHDTLRALGIVRE